MPAAAEILASKTWCVVGNLGKNPIVARLVATLQAADKEVSSVNPSGGVFDRDCKVEQVKRLVDLDPLPETLNLCINSHHGLQLITELVEAPRFPAGATKNLSSSSQERRARRCWTTARRTACGCTRAASSSR